MSPDEYLQNPWKDAHGHPQYRESFLNMRPAPEYASGETLLASLIRNIGMSGCLSEGKVPEMGRKLAKALESGRGPVAGSEPHLSPETMRNLLTGALCSPRLPNQSARRALQICPIVPDSALYSLSARLSANSWNPGELIARIVAFGSATPDRADEVWQDLFHKLSVGDGDDVWARIMQSELEAWRPEALKDAWQQPSPFEYPQAVAAWHDGTATIPAQQFVRDLGHILSLKNHLTRRQWTSLLESILRIGAASHVLWLCRIGTVCTEAITSVMAGKNPMSEAELQTRASVGSPFWHYGQASGHSIKNSIRGFLMSRLLINLLLWHCELTQNGSIVTNGCLSSLPAIAAFLERLAEKRHTLDTLLFQKHLHGAIDEYPRVVDGREGIGSNISEFLRHVLGQRMTSEIGLESYDQGYFLRKRGNYNTAPWIVSLGPAAVLALIHCCTHLAKGPRTVEDFCLHLQGYGIEMRAQDVPESDLGRTLRNLGLVLDSPDAEGGMVILSPFKTLKPSSH